MECIVCGDDFDEHSEQKKSAGGKINECPDCSQEKVVKYVGLQSADGKQAQASILRFKSNSDRDKYIKFWQNNSGLHKGKSCQLGSHLSTTPNIEFETLVDFSPTNHKGKQ